MSILATHAQDFLNAYEILRESNDSLVEQNTANADKGFTGKAFGILPAMGIDIVCLAFSVELHLKELHRVSSDNIPRGHKIIELFEKLSESEQEEVVSHHSIARYGWDDAQLKCELLAISDSFERWRYAYENTTLRYNVYFAKALIEALQFVAVKKREIGVNGGRPH